MPRQDFAFRLEPILIGTAVRVSALHIKFVGASANFGLEVRSPIVMSIPIAGNFRHLQYIFWGFGSSCAGGLGFRHLDTPLRQMVFGPRTDATTQRLIH